MNKYGALVEDLIRLKDHHRDDFTFDELNTINRACNTLEQEGEAAASPGPGEWERGVGW